MGTAAASSGAAGPSEGLRAGRSSGRTKPEYPAAGGRRNHATFGSGPTRQSGDRDSEPDYLLRPTRHGPGGTLLILAHSFFRAQVAEESVRTSSFEGDRCNDNFLSWRYFESVIKRGSGFGRLFRHYPHSVCGILVLFSNRAESEGAE